MKIEIYMKSGNVINLDGIEEANISNKGGKIVGLEIVRSVPLVARALMVQSIDLNQVEAVVYEDIE